MTNILTFPVASKALPEAKQDSTLVAPDTLYLYPCLDWACKVAGLIYSDMEAVDLLQAEKRLWLERKQGPGRVSFEVRKRCAKYLIKNEQQKLDREAALDIELGA